MSTKLTQIWSYPVKSLKGLSLESAAIDPRGIRNDRRWMIVDSDNHFLSQRQFPSLATISLEMTAGTIHLSHDAMKEKTTLPERAVEGQKVRVKIWSDTCDALWPKAEADAWISDYLKQDCKFVYMPDGTYRQVDRRYSPFMTSTAFTDGFPFLLINQASLNDLNERSKSVLTMQRFRPNLVIDSRHPFEEDTWRIIQIGNMRFHLVKPCARCVITTIDPATGSQGKEPLRTLSKYRKKNNKLYFGQNMVTEDSGILETGQRMIVEQKK